MKEADIRAVNHVEGRFLQPNQRAVARFVTRAQREARSLQRAGEARIAAGREGHCYVLADDARSSKGVESSRKRAEIAVSLNLVRASKSGRGAS